MVTTADCAGNHHNSYQATPQVTINHDVAANLESSNAFEGPEKLLEIWFAPSPKALPPGAKPNGLLAVPSESWNPMLEMVNCKVLSHSTTKDMDGYILSESSMFVAPHKIILKTCGTTTLLLGLRCMLRIAAKEAGFPFHNAASVDDPHAAATPCRVFYSRKNFLFPDKQQLPHKSWADECRFLDDTFENGSAYTIGRTNADHWYLYAAAPARVSGVGVSNGNVGAKIPIGAVPFDDDVEMPNDETLEMMMTDLDPTSMKQFYMENATCRKNASHLKGLVTTATGACEGKVTPSMTSASSPTSVHDETFDESGGDPGLQTPRSQQDSLENLDAEGFALGRFVAEMSGVTDIYPTSKYPDARVDSFLFSPCGFSANGLVPAVADAETGGGDSTNYFTIHVTPEPHCSYASFETNVPSGPKTAKIVESVARIFKPGRFCLTLFQAKNAGVASHNLEHDAPTNPPRSMELKQIPGYKRIDRIVHDLHDYDHVFYTYQREGSAGSGVRVGT